MEALDRIVGGGEDPVDVLNHPVRRQPAARLAQVHRSAAGVEAQAELLGDFDLGLEQSDDALGEDVVVVGRGRAAAERQLGEADLGGGTLPVRVNGGPDGIELAEPVKQPRLLGTDPGQRLVEVVVRVDQPGQRDQPAAVDHLGLLTNRWASLADPADHPAIDQHGAVLQLSACRVHGDDDLATVEQDHGRARRRSAARLTASRIFWYPVQRQRLPLSASRTVAGLGLGSFCSRSATATTKPGVQKPH